MQKNRSSSLLRFHRCDGSLSACPGLGRAVGAYAMGGTHPDQFDPLLRVLQAALLTTMADPSRHSSPALELKFTAVDLGDCGLLSAERRAL